MNKNTLKSKKAVFSTVLVITVIVSAFAQGNGIAGISGAAFIVSSHFDLGIKLIYAIGAVARLIGSARTHGRLLLGNPDTSKTAASWFGARAFLIVAATTLRSSFFQ